MERPIKQGAPGESDLVAAVSAFEGERINPQDIFNQCRENLEPNSIPGFLQVVPEIPKTISEKALDRILKEAFDPNNENVFTYQA